MTKITSLKVADIFRAQHTTRWHILREFGRNQSVAEHSFNVALLSREILSVICSDGPTGRANFDILVPRVLEWALVHDLPEVVLGDTVTITKRQAPAAFERMEREVDPDGADFKNALPKVVRDVVKVADLLDALRYLQDQPPSAAADYQMNSIKQSLFAALDKRLHEAARDAPAWADFSAVKIALFKNEVFHGRGTFVDEVFAPKPEMRCEMADKLQKRLDYIADRAVDQLQERVEFPAAHCGSSGANREVVWTQLVGDYREQNS